MDSDLKAQILSETSKIPWKDLQTFFASGKVINVEPNIDLIEVAHAITVDEKNQVEKWMNTNMIYPVTDEQAKQWVQNDSVLWAVVIKPWVLVQYKTNNNKLSS